MSQFCYVKIFSTNQNRNVLLLDDPGRVRSQITSVVCQIQRFDFDCNLVALLSSQDAKSNNTDTAGIRFKSSIGIYSCVHIQL